jgi:hypothetical protein
VEGRALFVEQDPPVLTPEFTGTVTFRVVYLGAVPALRVYHSTNSGYVYDEFPRIETGALGGREVSVFQPSFAMPELVRRFGFAIDFESGRGGALFMAPASVPVSGGFPITYDSFSVRAMSRLVGPVPVVTVDDTAQYSSHVVNGAAVALAWQRSTTPGVTYTVRAGSASGTGNIAQVPVGSATSLTGVVPPGRYFVRVRAATACGASADSNEIALSVGLPALSGAPGNFTHQVFGAAVMFAWQPATGSPSGYVIEAALTASGPAVVSLAAGNTTSFSVPSAPPGTYFVRVRASNAAGVGPASNEVTVVVPATATPP